MTPEKDAIPQLRSQIPHGVQDRFLVEAARRRQAEAVLRERFVSWGYQEVIPPTFEYYENLVVGASAELQRAMYRFFDHEGRSLALRADFTPQLARMAATKLFDRPKPLRCFYVGSLFRHEEPQAGRKREFTQAGLELLGVDTPAADAEVVALAIAALEALQLRDFQVNLGQMAFFRVLTEDLPADLLVVVRDAVDHKNSTQLAAALAEAGVAGDWHELLYRLPDLIGGLEILEEARTLSAGLPGRASAMAALDRLEETYGLLQAHGVAGRVILDLGEVRGMDYYTGITFRGVAPGLGWPIVSGGRYDDLIANFGRPLAAVGLGLGIERALLVQARQGATPPSIAAHVLVSGCDDPACLALAERLRQQGLRVEIDPLGIDAAGLGEQAHQRGIPRTLRRAGGEWLLAEVADLPRQDERKLAEVGLLQEAATWL
jgi:ATP phosphoribosyltransferase regulatory subunit